MSAQPNVNPFSAEVPQLLQHHFDQLHRESGVALDVIRDRGCYSVLGPAELASLGFSERQRAKRQLPGLILPIRGVDGGAPGNVYRPDAPRTDAKGKELKYELPLGSAMHLDCPPRCQLLLADPAIELWITEGQKKADAGASHGLCILAVLGVWNFKGRNAKGGVTWLADWDFVALNGRKVFICFDSDIMHKATVRDACDRLRGHLTKKGAAVTLVYLPGGPNGEKVGLDDYLKMHSRQELEALATAAPPAPTVNPPAIELLDEAPLAIKRPLTLVGGTAYVVTWVWAKKTANYDEDKDGKIVYYDPPIVQTTRIRVVVRDDGVTFGEYADKPLADLGVTVALPGEPREGKLWSAPGVKSYRNGQRPDGLDLFRRLAALVDHFVSFERSLGSQGAMCELIACYVLTTWFLDTFTCIGFLWPSGGYGSGKTKLGMLICEVAYLGEVLLSGSTYATLRDLADMGATLLFDDVEELTDPRKSDPDKRNLLLAGNRKGAVITVKEPGPDKTWKTRYVDAYCARLFTATRLPDPILASRTIIVPLMRTADAAKANRDVQDHAAWNCDRNQLLSDLWAYGLSCLPKIGEHEAAVNRDAPLVGRELEPWRPILSVARFLSCAATLQRDERLAGLYDRMVGLACAYQKDRPNIEAPDFTRLIVRALIAACAKCAESPSAPSGGEGTGLDAPLEIAVADIVAEANAIAREEDLSDGDAYTSDKRVGKCLTHTLRLTNKAPHCRGPRKRVTSLAEVERFARSYGLTVPWDSSPHDTAPNAASPPTLGAHEHSAHLAQCRPPNGRVRANDAEEMMTWTA